MIVMTTPIVEMDGDEMTRIVWDWVKEILIFPYVDLKTEYFDLGLRERDRTEDRVTEEAAEATRRLKVAVKCATITPNAQRVEEYKLRKMWPSPNATIRKALDGTVFRTPILIDGIEPYVTGWKQPITLARHAYGDIYLAQEESVRAGESAYLTICDSKGKEVRKRLIHEFDSPGVVSGMHNTDDSIEKFARSCFEYALAERRPLWFAAKDTISKTYDRRFKDIFARLYAGEYEEKFRERGISYTYTLIDDAAARAMRSEGGFVWACKNYDGDVMSDMVASAYGSLGMMSSVLVSPDGAWEYEAAHGTVTKHYYRYLAGEETSTNSVATIWAWAGALQKRGELDRLPELCDFAGRLRKATVDTIESGFLTGDLLPLFRRNGDIIPQELSTRAFLRKVAELL